MCGFTSIERKRNTELKELLGMEPINLVINPFIAALPRAVFILFFLCTSSTIL